MGVQLNIKSDEAYALAAELAELTGESLTAAVTRALRERLERERTTRDVDTRVRQMLAMAADIRAHLRQPASSRALEELYDENGFPA